MKRCSKCSELKSLEDFHKASGKKSGLKSQCKVCVSSWAAQHYVNNAEALLERSWKNQGIQITLAEYDLMYDSQGGVCAICGMTDPSGRRLSVDHDHETGTVRGLLCSPCNVGLGMFKDSTTLLAKTIVYLERN